MRKVLSNLFCTCIYLSLMLLGILVRIAIPCGIVELIVWIFEIQSNRIIGVAYIIAFIIGGLKSIDGIKRNISNIVELYKKEV